MTYSCPHCGALAEDAGADDAWSRARRGRDTTLRCSACHEPVIVALMTPSQYRAWVDALSRYRAVTTPPLRAGRPHVTVGLGVQVPGTSGRGAP